MGAILSYFHKILLNKASTAGIVSVDSLVHQDTLTGEGLSRLDESSFIKQRSGHQMPSCFWHVYSSFWFTDFHCCFMFIFWPSTRRISQELSITSERCVKNEDCRPTCSDVCHGLPLCSARANGKPSFGSWVNLKLAFEHVYCDSGSLEGWGGGVDCGMAKFYWKCLSFSSFAPII